MVVLWLGLSLLSSVSKHNTRSYQCYGWVCLYCHQSINIIYGRIMVGLSLLFSVSKHNTIYVNVLLLDLSLLSSVSKHNR